jgi:hypothetical protein
MRGRSERQVWRNLRAGDDISRHNAATQWPARTGMKLPGPAIARSAIRPPGPSPCARACLLAPSSIWRSRRLRHSVVPPQPRPPSWRRRGDLETREPGVGQPSIHRRRDGLAGLRTVVQTKLSRPPIRAPAGGPHRPRRPPGTCTVRSCRRHSRLGCRDPSLVRCCGWARPPSRSGRDWPRQRSRCRLFLILALTTALQSPAHGKLWGRPRWCLPATRGQAETSTVRTV